MVLTRNLEKVLLQEKSRAEDVESEPPEIGAEDQPAPGDALDDNGSGGEEENFEETRSESLRDPPSGGADDAGSDGGEKENANDVRSQSLRDPPSGGGDDNGSNGGSQSLSDPDSSYSDEEEEEELEPMRPLRMYFLPTEYCKKMKLSTRCYLQDVFETFRDLRPALTDNEKNWFETHPQFKHIFHMPRDRNHKLQGIWTLLLRTACIEKEKEVWFVVNGVPIRYGLREHALISGLYSHNYPSGFAENTCGKMSFVEKYFKLGSTVRYQDLKPMLEKMKPSPKSNDRLRMLILYFLASIIKGQMKTGEKASSVDPFLLRAVGDMNLCRTFPWGRLSYDHMLKGISKTMTHFNGAVPGIEKQDQPWPIPGFILPLELLAFEAIPELGERFLEPFPSADEECPKMCKSMFKNCDMK
uniref:DUF1985 domain-containing protein n=1 Tax=Noccaea caerulescens TaxID=107243 RepID=A0A1J3FKA6_NOCCA